MTQDGDNCRSRKKWQLEPINQAHVESARVKAADQLIT